MGIAISHPKYRYFDSWKEEIVMAIILDGAKKWDIIQQVTGLSDFSLKENLDELLDLGVIEKINEDYTVNLEMWNALNNEYQDSDKFSKQKKKALIDWIKKWNANGRLCFSLEKGQFYLDGRRLEEFIKKIISKAESEILIVNPNVNECSLCETLKESCKRGTTLKVITRPPDEVKSLYGWNKKEYHSSLKKAGITVRYNNNVHAKMITVDRTVAIISSIDFCHYSVGNSFDAGIISLEETVIELIINSILKIFEISDTKADITKLNKP